MLTKSPNRQLNINKTRLTLWKKLQRFAQLTLNWFFVNQIHQNLSQLFDQVWLGMCTEDN